MLSVLGVFNDIVCRGTHLFLRALCGHARACRLLGNAVSQDHARKRLALGCKNDNDLIAIRLESLADDHCAVYKYKRLAGFFGICRAL